MPDALAQFKQWISIEKQPDIETQRKNEDYDNKVVTPEELKKQKDTLLQGLYGKTIDIQWVNSDLKSDLTVDKSEVIQSTESWNEKIESHLEDSPYFPILKRLENSWEIDSQNFETFSKMLESSTSKEQEKKIFLNIIKNLPSNEIAKNILSTFDNREKVTPENFEQTEFAHHISQLEIKTDNGIGGLEIMMAEKYISIPNEEWELDIWADIELVMDISLNTILEWASEDFKKKNAELIGEIRMEKDINMKYGLLKKLYKEDLKRDAQLWWKKWLIEIEMKKKSLQEKAKKLTQDISNTVSINDKKERDRMLWILVIKKLNLLEEWRWIDGLESELNNFSANIKTLWGAKTDKSVESQEKKESA